MDSTYLKQILPTAWADLRIVDSFTISQIDSFAIPFIAVSGKNDDRVSFFEMEEWKSFTSSSFIHHVLNGDHFFLRHSQSQADLLQIIRKTLQTFVLQEEYNYGK
jgi:surfactin synthase thioesterase subunit